MIALPAPLAARLAGEPLRWTISGTAGFIGSHLLETLLRAGQHVTTDDDLIHVLRADIPHGGFQCGQVAVYVVQRGDSH